MRINPSRATKAEAQSNALALQPMSRYSAQGLLRRRSTGSRRDEAALKLEQALEIPNNTVAKFSKVNAVSPFVEKTFELVSVDKFDL
jgi:hypothetical protein